MYEDLDDARMLPGIKDLGGTRCQEKALCQQEDIPGFEADGVYCDPLS